MKSTSVAGPIEKFIRTRRSVRGFLPDPVAPAKLEEIFSLARFAPSNCNTQPWVVHVLSGAPADDMRSALEDAALRKIAATPDIPLPSPYTGLYRERQIDAAKQVFAAQGIERHDLDGRDRSMMRNFKFFDAPHVAFLFMPAGFGMREAVDCGIYAQTLMLAMAAYGIGSCAQGALSIYASIVHEKLGLSEDLLLLFGIAFGYEDSAHPANRAQVDRAPLDEVAIFHG